MEKKGRDFDWLEDGDDVVVHEQHAVAVYQNPAGDLVIRQAGWPDEDKVIVVEIGKVDELVRGICERADLTVGKSAKDRTGAERQRRYRKRHRNGVNGAEASLS